MENKSHQFDKIVFADSKIIILGSFPSVISLKENFYYMNKNNRFYKVLAVLFNDDFTNKDINKKIELLKKHHIALYDVIKSCTINNSSDASISNVVPNDIDKIIKNSKIKKIFLNGKKAYELFIKYFPNLQNMAYLLPSTSSANASYSLEKLILQWSIIKLELDRSCHQ